MPTPRVDPLFPDLCTSRCYGGILQPSSIDNFLRRNTSLRRYRSVFTRLCNSLHQEAVYPFTRHHMMILCMVFCNCSQFLQWRPETINQVCYFGQGLGRSSELIPSLSLTKEWIKLIQKHGDFWDLWPLLRHLASVLFTTLQNNLSQLRLHLTLVFPLFRLIRSSDLSEIRRFES